MSQLDHRPTPPADVLIKGAHVLDPRTGIDARARRARPRRQDRRDRRPTSQRRRRGHRRRGQAPLPGLRRPARAPARARAGAQGGPRDRHALGGRRRLRRRRGDAEHEPDRRLRPDPAQPARGRPPRGARPRRLPRLGHDRPARRGADRDGRAARRPARSASPTTASPSTAPGCCARRCSTRSSWAGSSPCTRRTRRSRATASCTRARSPRGSAWPASRASASRR